MSLPCQMAIAPFGGISLSRGKVPLQTRGFGSMNYELRSGHLKDGFPMKRTTVGSSLVGSWLCSWCCIISTLIGRCLSHPSEHHAVLSLQTLEEQYAMLTFHLPASWKEAGQFHGSPSYSMALACKGSCHTAIQSHWCPYHQVHSSAP